MCIHRGLPCKRLIYGCKYIGVVTINMKIPPMRKI